MALSKYNNFQAFLALAAPWVLGAGRLEKGYLYYKYCMSPGYLHVIA
jgi:hypothetical protein